MSQAISLLSTLISFLLGFSFIAAVHELGHLLMAKWCGIRVNRYMVFFPPKLFSWRWGDTEYGLGSIPLGGFVEIEGMGEDTAADAKEPAPWDFRTKPAWQRSLVMIGGILFNLLSAYLLIACLLVIAGTPYLAKEGLNEHGIAPTTLGQEVGLMRGDKVVQVNGHDFKEYTELFDAILEEGPLSYTVIRDEKQLEVAITADVQQQLKEQLQEGKETLFVPLYLSNIKKVEAGSAADKAGLAPGDSITSINGKPTPYVQDLQEVLADHQEEMITIVYQRDGQTITTQVMLPKEGKLGIQSADALPRMYKRYSLGPGLVEAGRKVTLIASLQIQGIMKIITRKVSFLESVQSPVAIAGMFSQYEGFSGCFFLFHCLCL